MFNKFYESVKRFIRDNIVFIIIISVFLVFTFVEVPYEVNMPGGVITLNDRVSIDDKDIEIKGTFNMAYVSSVRGNIPYVLLGMIIPDWDVVPYSASVSDNESIKDADKRSKLYLEQSKAYAKAVAFDVAGIKYNSNNKINYVAYIDSKAKTTLRVGDNIVKMDGEVVTDINIMSNYIQTKKVGDNVSFEVLRDDKTKQASATIYEENGRKYVGISALTIFEVESDININIKSKPSESGPSGGLMMTLMVYNAVTKQDLTHGKNIVGTGTINLDGTVGEIGGIKYKLIGAVNNNADVFLVPKNNYKEAMKVKKDKGFDIQIVSIETFSDAVDYLEGMK